MAELFGLVVDAPGQVVEQVVGHLRGSPAMSSSG
jgi:hypothetical protein